MILLALASCLLFFVTYFTGIFIRDVLQKFLAVTIAANFPELFFFGLMAGFVYLNLLSFFAAINYSTLLPLLLLSIFIFSKKAVRQHFFMQARQTAKLFFAKKHLFFIGPLTCLLFFYWIIPPLNWDSGQYHYISIRWYEQFRIIPGLANVHGRLGFNPANFIISAAWSFTGIVGQPLYPLNGVLVLLFYVWLLKRILVPTPTFCNVVVFITAILLFRITLTNISSPSSDLLSGILLFYCGLKTYELLKAGKDSFGDYFPVLIISCFSVTAKLSAVPALLILPFVYFLILRKEKYFLVAVKCLLLAGIIALPWLARNFLLSGYLLYPVPASNIFHADWVVPHNVIQLDYIYSKYGPRTITVDFVTMQHMNIVQLTGVWFRYMYAHSFFSLLLALLAILSPLAWLAYPLLKKKIPIKIFLLWSIYYLAVWLWFINSPEHRFGLSYLILAIVLPVFECMPAAALKQRIYLAAVSAAMCFFCLYYPISVLKRDGLYHFSLGDCWLKPPRDYQYFKNNDIHTFPFVNLKNGVKLYLPDDRHDCLNADGPCMGWRYGEIEMRGNKIEDGFRNKKDEVKKYFPFVELE